MTSPRDYEASDQFSPRQNASQSQGTPFNSAGEMFQKLSDGKYLGHLFHTVKKFLTDPNNVGATSINKIYACQKTINERVHNVRNRIASTRRSLETAIRVQERDTERDLLEYLDTLQNNRKRLEMYQVVFFFLKTRYESESQIRKARTNQDRVEYTQNACEMLEQKYDLLRDSHLELESELGKKHEYGDVTIVKDLMKSCGECMDEVRRCLASLRKN